MRVTANPRGLVLFPNRIRYPVNVLLQPGMLSEMRLPMTSGSKTEGEGKKSMRVNREVLPKIRTGQEGVKSRPSFFRSSRERRGEPPRS